MSDTPPDVPQPPDTQPTAPYPPAPPAYGTQPAQPPAYGAAPAYGTPPAYSAPPAYGYGYGAQPKTNTLAVVSLIASIAGIVFVPLIGSVVGIITGHISLSQLKTSGEQGRGLALGGTITGWVGLGLVVLGIILALAFFSFVMSAYPGSIRS